MGAGLGGWIVLMGGGGGGGGGEYRWWLRECYEGRGWLDGRGGSGVLGLRCSERLRYWRGGM